MWYNISELDAANLIVTINGSETNSMVLLKDMLGEKDFTVKDFDKLDGKVLLLHLEKDIFSKNDQEALTGLFSRPEVHTMKGGHIAFVIRSPEYIAIIREFLKRLPQL